MQAEAIMIAGVALVFVVLVIGVFLYLRSNQKDTRTRPAVRKAEKPVVLSADPIPTQKTGQDGHEIAAIYRDPKTGQLFVVINGSRCMAPGQIEENKRVELQRVAKELFMWLGGKIEPSGTPPQPQKPGEGTAAVVPATAPAPNAFIESDTPLPGGTMVEQIDVILQSLLLRSPLANQSIKIMEDPRRGVVVWVGLKSYAGIDAVPDPQISALLRQAVVEWERRDELQRRKVL